MCAPWLPATEHWPVALQAWTQERTAYLGTVLSKMLRGYTDAAVSFTSTLLSFISRFAIQVSRAARQIGCSSGAVPSAASVVVSQPCSNCHPLLFRVLLACSHFFLSRQSEAMLAGGSCELE